MIPIWTRQYIGLPFTELGRGPDAFDCWGLARKVLADQAGLDLPAYGDGEAVRFADPRSAGVFGDQIDAGIATGWSDVAKEPITDHRPFDLVLFKARGRWRHIGVIAAPGWMLHIGKGFDAAMARYDRYKYQRWGVYRYG